MTADHSPGQPPDPAGSTPPHKPATLRERLIDRVRNPTMRMGSMMLLSAIVFVTTLIAIAVGTIVFAAS